MFDNDIMYELEIGNGKSESIDGASLYVMIRKYLREHPDRHNSTVVIKTGSLPLYVRDALHIATPINASFMSSDYEEVSISLIALLRFLELYEHRFFIPEIEKNYKSSLQEELAHFEEMFLT